MEFRDTVLQRASVRQFKSDPVPVEDIKKMVEMALHAPSVNNSQPWKFIAVTNKDLINCIAESVKHRLHVMFPDLHEENSEKVRKQVEWFSTFFVDAPVLFAVTLSPYKAVVDEILERGGMNHETMNEIRNHPDIQSVGAAVQNLLLAATDMGYGACWLSGPMVASDDIESCLKIEHPSYLAAMVACGVPDHKTSQSEKKPLEEVFELKD